MSEGYRQIVRDEHRAEVNHLQAEIERLRETLTAIATGRKRILGYSLRNAEEAAKAGLARREGANE